MRTRSSSLEVQTPAKQTRGRTRRSRSSPPSQVGVPNKDDDSSLGDQESFSSLDDTSEEERDEELSVATPILRKSSSKTPSSTPSIRSKNPTRSNSRGLPQIIQAALAKGIEEGGGIVAFFQQPQALGALCANDTNQFGVYGSTRRNQVQNKARWWRELPAGEYHRAIRALGVTPYCDTVDREKAVDTGAQSTPVSRPTPRPNKKGTPKVSLQAAAPKALRTATAAPKSTPRPAPSLTQLNAYRNPKPIIEESDADESPAPKQLFFSPTASRRKVTPTPYKMSNSVRSGKSGKSSSRGGRPDEAVGAIPITINPKYPETGIVLKVFPFFSYSHEGRDCDGFEFSFDADYRHFKAGNYKFSVFDGNKVLYQRPAYESMYLEDADRKQYEKKEKDETFHKGRNFTFLEENFEDDEEEFVAPKDRVQKFVFQLPTGCHLSNDPFRTVTKQGAKYWQASSCTIKYRTGDKDVHNKNVIGFVVQLSFKALDLNSGRHHTGTGANHDAEQLSNDLAGIDFSYVDDSPTRASPAAAKQPTTAPTGTMQRPPAPTMQPAPAASTMRQPAPAAPTMRQPAPAEAAPVVLARTDEGIDRKAQFKTQPSSKEARASMEEARRLDKKNKILARARAGSASPGPNSSDPFEALANEMIRDLDGEKLIEAAYMQNPSSVELPPSPSSTDPQNVEDLGSQIAGDMDIDMEGDVSDFSD